MSTKTKQLAQEMAFSLKETLISRIAINTGITDDEIVDLILKELQLEQLLADREMLDKILEPDEADHVRIQFYSDEYTGHWKTVFSREAITTAMKEGE